MQGAGRDQTDWRSAFGVGLAGALGLALLSSLMTRETVPKGDDLIYERMAQHPFATHTFPFAYRVGLPWLVHVLPFSHNLSFSVLAWAAAGGAAAFAYLLMRHFEAPEGLATGLALALALSPPLLLVALRGGRNTDAATLLFMMAATLFVVQRRLKLLTATLILGVLVREAELFIVPLAYAVWAERWWDPAAARRTAATGAPAVALYLGLRLGMSTVGEAQVPGYGVPLVAGRLTILGQGLREFPTEVRRMLSIFGPLWVAAPLALARMPFARRGLVLVGACLLSMTFALDWGRMILLAAPVIYPAGAFTLRTHPRWRAPALVTFALLIVAYAIYMQHSGTRIGIIDSRPPPYPLR
jgi:hypothetical protein